MSIGNKIKLSKLITSRELSRSESAFLFSIMNIVGSVEEAYDVLFGYTSTKSTSQVVASNFSFDDHIKISYSILSKAKDAKITQSDIEHIEE